MAISRQALDQVRSILRELDQRIDSAREQRTSDRVQGVNLQADSPASVGRNGATEPPVVPGRARPKRPSL